MSYSFALRLFVAVSVVLFSSGLSASAQRRKVSIADRRTVDVRKGVEEPTRAPSRVGVTDYVFGSGDVVGISVADSPEMSGTFQVSDTGYIAIPLLGQVQAAGLNGTQLTKSISDTLKSAELLVEPIVDVTIEQYHSRTVLVLGAVARPAVYPLQRPTTLLDVISLAGGLAPDAGNTVTISHKQDSATETQPLVAVDLAKLVRGNDPVGDVEVHSGDVVNVSLASVVYVVGAVNKPGGFVIEDPSSGITILQAVALAEGLQPIAASNRGLLLRKARDGKPREEVPVDIASLLKQKTVDRSLEPNDILFIPESGSKRTFHAMGRVAEAGIIGVTTYGFGLRLGAK